MRDPRISVRLPQWLVDTLTALGERNGRTFSAELRIAALEHVYAAAEEPQNGDHPGELAAGPGDRNPIALKGHAP